MRMTAIIALAALLVSGSAIAQSPNALAFQGLDGRSGQADVLKTFSKASRGNQCSNGEVTARSGDGETACETLVVEAYKIDNTDFELNFIFSTEGKLRYVFLIHHYGSPHRDLPGVKKEEIMIRYRSLADLLATRYGPDVIASPGNTVGLAGRIGEIEWQPGRGPKWAAGGDRVTLSADAMEKRLGPGTYWGSVQIFYVFGRRSEADRL